MFFSPSTILAFFLSLLLVGQVAAAPLPMPMVASVERGVKRQTVPVEQASKSDGNRIVPYKRRDVPVQQASKSDGNVVVPYERRDVPVQQASKSDGNEVVPYKRYSEIPLELAVRSVNGVVELY